MRFYIHLQFLIAVVILVIQMIKQKKNIIHKKWAPIKIILNFLIFKIYLINIISDVDIIFDYVHFRTPHTAKSLNALESTLFQLAIFVFIGLLYIILYMKNVEKVDFKKGNFITLYAQTILLTTVQIILLQSPMVFLVALLQVIDPIDQMKTIQIFYVRLLLLLSALSSMDPILKILVYQPLDNFKKAYSIIAAPKIQHLKYEYVQLKNNEFYDAFTNDQNEGDNILKFDSEEGIQENGSQSIQQQEQKDISIFSTLKNYFVMGYYAVQMLFTLVVVLAFICIAIQMIYPSADIVSSLNVINMCQGSVEVELPRILEASVVSVFKVLFIIFMYFSSQNQISFTTSNKLMDNVNSLVVLIRKSLLNFSLIALLTTLYPNLTFTINNSDCFKDIQYQDGSFINNKKCPATIISLITMKLFETNPSIIAGLFVLLLYTFYSIYLIIKVFRNRQ